MDLHSTNTTGIIGSEQSYDVIEIAPFAFTNNRVIQNVFIPSTIEIIGESAFQYAWNIQSLTIENNSQLKVIGSRAFFAGGNMESISLPVGLHTIGEAAFRELRLSAIYVAEGNIYFQSIDGV